jgi:hypothetical protein
MHATCPADFILLDLICLIISGDETFHWWRTQLTVDEHTVVRKIIIASMFEVSSTVKCTFFIIRVVIPYNILCDYNVSEGYNAFIFRVGVTPVLGSPRIADTSTWWKEAQVLAEVLWNIIYCRETYWVLKQVLL